MSFGFRRDRNKTTSLHLITKLNNHRLRKLLKNKDQGMNKT